MTLREIIVLLKERIRLAEEGSTNAVELSREEALAILASLPHIEPPTHCEHCGVLLQGGATHHKKSCPWYAISYQGLMDKR